jgi:hypothetical protein
VARLAGRFVVIAVFVLMAAPGAGALTRHRQAFDDYVFSGSGCGATDSFRLRLPDRARKIVVARPVRGSELRDELTGKEVATITAARVDHSGGGRAVVWTATGSGSACQPGASDYQNAWQTGAVELVARYTTYWPVWSGGYFARARPRRVYFGAHEWIERIHWRGWDGPRARGRGIYPVDDCTPDCARGQFHRHRVRVSFWRPRWCKGAYRYSRLGWTFVGTAPAYRRRHELYRYQCAEARPAGKVAATVAVQRW